MNRNPVDDKESGKNLAVAIQVLKSRPGWLRAELMARVNSDLALNTMRFLTRPEDREAAVLKAFDAKAQPYLELVEDKVTRDAFLCLLEHFCRSTSPRLAGHKYADPASTEAQHLRRQIETRAQYWRDQAELRAGRQDMLATPEQHLADEYAKYGALAPLFLLKDQLAHFLDQLSTTTTMPHRRGVSQTPNEDRRAAVDDFLRRCNALASSKISRTHIWKAVGHRKARQFEYWQAGSDKATQADDDNFRRILAMEPSDFISLLKKKRIAPGEP